MIALDSVSRRYGSTLAVQELSFQIGRGAVVGFLGPNGAGKTTTMRMITGSLGASLGQVTVGGFDLSESPREAKALIGYLPEQPPLYPHMVVEDYLRYAAQLRGVPDIDAALSRVLEEVDLGEVAHRIIAHLSKGYRQRVGLAQALIHDPQVLILDEPTSGLDPAQRVEIRSLIRKLAAQDRTVVLSTHILAEVEAVCEEVILIHRGRLRLQCPLEALSSPQVALRVEDQETDLSPSLRALEAVESVQALGAGSYRLRCREEARPAIARLAVEHGLLELKGEQGLEERYLQLTSDSSLPGEA